MAWFPTYCGKTNKLFLLSSAFMSHKLTSDFQGAGPEAEMPELDTAGRRQRLLKSSGSWLSQGQPSPGGTREVTQQAGAQACAPFPFQTKLKCNASAPTVLILCSDNTSGPHFTRTVGNFRCSWITRANQTPNMENTTSGIVTISRMLT